MKMLDAICAFVLTMGVLATVVTLIMEVGHRIFRVRKGNLISILKRLSTEIAVGPLKLDARRRWDFITKVLNNPTLRKGSLPESKVLLQAPGGVIRLPTALWPTKVFKTIPTGSDLGDKDWEALIEGLGRIHGLGGIYDKVTLEHVLRRLSEIPEVKFMVATATKIVEREMDRLARKFEEFSSAASASFKRRAQFWSSLVGILLALTFNIDAARIFQAYMADQKLSQTMVTQLSKKEKDAREITRTYEDLKNNAPETPEPSPEQLEKAQAALKQATDTLDAVSGLGVPIGYHYFPYCLLFGDGGEKCVQKKEKISWIQYFLWSVSIVFSGLLIGLGAPFWFDVAKRLAAVRTMFGGTPSDEMLYGGQETKGDPKTRRTIVSEVVTDALYEWEDGVKV
jgi:hypothetical protein